MGTHFHSIFPNENFLDLKPYQYGWEECAPLHSFGPFIRNHYLFHYIISGKGMLFSHAVNGDVYEYELGTGQGFLICPGQINLYTADAQDPWHYVWVEFDGMRVPEYLWNAGLEQDKPIYQPRTAEEGDVLRDHLLYFSQHAARSPLHLVGHLSLFLDNLIEYSSRRRGADERERQDYYIHEAVVYIQQNYQRQLTVDEVAGFCKLNRNYFSRRFKEVVGCSPQEFIIRTRLTSAAELLRSTGLPVKTVADRCGYPNQLHFSQAFHKYYGLPPREWRKQNKDQPPQ